MSGIKKSLRAATMLESMVAMTIIVTCLAIGTMIFVNVLNADKDRVSLKAMLMLSKESIKLKEEKEFIDGEEIKNDYTIQWTFVKYDNTENLFQMTLRALDENGKLLLERKELILTE